MFYTGNNDITRLTEIYKRMQSQKVPGNKRTVNEARLKGKKVKIVHDLIGEAMGDIIYSQEGPLTDPSWFEEMSEEDQDIDNVYDMFKWKAKKFLNEREIDVAWDFALHLVQGARDIIFGSLQSFSWLSEEIEEDYPDWIPALNELIRDYTKYRNFEDMKKRVR